MKLLNANRRITRHYWWWPEQFRHGCPILVNGIHMVIPMVHPRHGYTVRELRDMAEKWHAENDREPPAHTVIARVATEEGTFIGITCLGSEPKQEWSR